MTAAAASHSFAIHFFLPAVVLFIAAVISMIVSIVAAIASFGSGHDNWLMGSFFSLAITGFWASALAAVIAIGMQIGMWVS